jgi:isopenicillin-N N-acyltransferase like protein
VNESNTAAAVPDVILRGGPEDRGALHGTHLREKIEGVVEFYGNYIGMREADVFVAARHFKKVIEDYSIEYAREITALADAAGIDPLWIFAVNARSEIAQFGQNECTAAFFPNTGLLGQTWDWFAAAKDLIAVVQIELPGGHTFVMMTEPGIIGKIGLNSAGLGVCLNYLTDPEDRRGLPIHILMRAILDSASIADAKQRIEAAGNGRSGNLLIGAADGDALSIEFRNAASYVLPADKKVYLHTNHYRYRGCDLVTGTPNQRENTRRRLARAENLVATFKHHSTDEMLELLSDCTDHEHPIYAPYREYEGIGTIGTVCTLMMDLPAKQLRLRRGNGPADGFVDYQL